MSPDRVGRRGAEGAEASERLEEGSPSRRGRNDEPSSTPVVAEHARDENDHHDETAHLKQLHALLRRSDAWRTHALVRLATSRGFVDAETRQSAWPRVLGICEIDKRAFRDAAARTHLDSSVVDADVERSLWAFTSAWRESDREATRAKLRRVIDGVVNVHGDEQDDEDKDEDDDANGGLKKNKPRRQKSRRVHYYQGFHDVCSVLLLNCGEKIACGVAERLAVFHLRDCTRPALAPLLDSLCLLDPLLESADESLHEHVFGEHWSTNDAFFADVFLRAFIFGTPNETETETLARDGLRRCVFAVAWQMTWHVHGIGDLCGGVKNAPPPEEALPDDEKNEKNEEHFFARRADAFRLRVASRLVDFFLTTHPAMPLYVGVEAMIRNRAYLLSVGRDEPAELHVALAKLRVAPDWRPYAGKERGDDDDFDYSADATETAAFEALERSLLSARELFRAYPPEEMYRRARIQPPPGCAHAKYPYPWLKNATDDADANGETKKKKKNKRRFDDDEDAVGETFKISLARAPLPPEVFREDLDGVRTTNGDDDGAWHRTPFRKRRASALRSRIVKTYERIVTQTAPPCVGAFCFFAVVFDLGSAERIERTVVFKVADVCTDPIFRELLWFVFARGAYYHAARITRYAGAVAKTVAAVVAVSVSIARGPFKLLRLKGVLATADRWLSAASHTVRFANASWYARSRVGGTSPRKIER